ncbi:MAG: DNA repair protein RecN [Muribaculaceae bacterium]|nr:DNA repair protein RecN [Muribaculaceae bacterium]
MLKRLTIKNYILIDSLTIEFDKGLSVITGETGAGKSILVGALGLLAGAKPDTKNISPGATKSIIEGAFDISKLSIEKIFEENDIDYEDETIIRREINENGKSRAFVNDTPVTVTFLKELSNHILEIHSQHQNLLLADNSFQLDAVDIYSSNSQLLQQYQMHYAAYQQAQKQLKQLIAQHEQAKQEEEYIKFVVAQLQEASLKEGEEVELEAEQNQLSHAEEIKEALYKSSTLFDDEDGVISKLSTIASEIKSINKKVKTGELSERIESLYIEAKDIASEVSSMAEATVYDPDRLQQVEERLSLIYTLQKRYTKTDVASLLQYQKELEGKLQTIDGGDEAIKELQKEIASLKNILTESAKKLSKARQQGGEQFAEALENMARPLSLPNINFKVEWESTEDFTENGTERAIYTFSANKNMPLTPLSKSASGGEISRMMLCVKAMIAANRTMPVMLFDEIDSGISGETAGKVGKIMAEMAADRQIIVITHLPQVAAKGANHYNISKQDIADRTVATVKQLTEEERVAEVARMMSDGELTPAALSLATQLLTQNN